MSTLLEQLEADYKTAMKAQDRLRIDTIRLVKAAVQRVEIEKRKPLEDPDVVQILSHQAKQRRETIEAAKQSSRTDVLTQATNELAILTGYLPKALSEEAIKQLIEEAIASVGLQQGPIMKAVMGKAAGAADGKLVSQLVAARLKQG